MIDHRTNTAARAEGAFLTIVGSPVNSMAGNRERGAPASSEARAGSSGKKHHNIYIAWLMPRTKICECTDESASTGRSSNSGREERQNRGQGQGVNQNDKKEIAFEQLEVGDHVDIQFSPGEESASNPNRGVHQSERMRQQHGRHRTFVGYVTAITVMPCKDHDKGGSATEATSGERAR
jgi:hypothetical protein